MQPVTNTIHITHLSRGRGTVTDKEYEVINSPSLPANTVPLLLAAAVAIFLAWLWFVRRKKYD
jgi:hypothetical protein